MTEHPCRQPRPSVTYRLAFVFVGLLGGSAPAPAQVVVTTASQSGASNTFSVSNADLFQTNLGSIATTGSFASFAANTPSLLADGAFGPSGNSSNGAGVAVVAPQDGATITFNLDVSANPTGYTLTQLTTFASWDRGRDGQEYSVSYSKVTAPTTFLSLASVPQFNPDVPVFDAHTRVSLTDQSGVLAEGVAAVRFTFTSFENDGTAYREFDAVGSVTPVPEPSFMLLVSAGFVGSLAWYRRQPDAAADPPKAAGH